MCQSNSKDPHFESYAMPYPAPEGRLLKRVTKRYTLNVCERQPQDPQTHQRPRREKSGERLLRNGDMSSVSSVPADMEEGLGNQPT